MANNIGNITQLFRGVDKSENGSPASKIRGPSSKSNGKKDVKGTGKFGDSAKVELSKEAEMYGKVVDLLQQKYDNADIFVAGSNDDISKIGGELEYSIILSEDEMKLLASDDPKDEEAKNKLMGQIDDAMNNIKDLNEKIGQNIGEDDEVSNFGIKMDKFGKLSFFADVNGKSYTESSMESLVKTLFADKTSNE